MHRDARLCPKVRRYGVVWRNSVVRFRGRTRPGDGGIAQLGEHLLCKQGVNGSIPFISTKWAHSSAG